MRDWQYEPAQDLDKNLFERLAGFPREPDMLVYGVRSLAALALRGWLRTYHRLTIDGRQNLPSEGSFVMVANHASHLDALCLLSALPLGKLHCAFPAAAADYFFVSLPRSAVTALLVNALPFCRQVQIRQSMALCRRVLERPGNVLILFPGGTRSTEAGIGSFKPGIGALLAGTSIPAVPCGLVGAREALPKGAWLPSPRRVRLLIGAPKRFDTIPATRSGMESIAGELEQAVRALVESR